MDKKILIALTLVVLFSAGMYGLNSKSNIQTLASTSLESLPSGNLGYDAVGAVGWVCRDVKLPDGTILSHECNKNTFTNNGLNETAKRLFLADGSPTAFKYIALGNGSAPAVTDTALGGEIADACLTPQGRSDFSANCRYVGNANVTCWYQFTINCNMGINSTGTYNASTSGVFLQGASFTNASLQPTWLLNVSITREYKVG